MASSTPRSLAEDHAGHDKSCLPASKPSKEHVPKPFYGIERTKYAVGMISLAMVVFLWVSSSFITSHVLKTFPKPFFTTYVATTTFQLYFLFIYLGSKLKVWTKTTAASSADEELPSRSPSSSHSDAESITKKEVIPSKIEQRMHKHHYNHCTHTYNIHMQCFVLHGRNVTYIRMYASIFDNFCVLTLS